MDFIESSCIDPISRNRVLTELYNERSQEKPCEPHPNNLKRVQSHCKYFHRDRLTSGPTLNDGMVITEVSNLRRS